jgi:hypothetical protein
MTVPPVPPVLPISRSIFYWAMIFLSGSDPNATNCQLFNKNAALLAPRFLCLLSPVDQPAGSTLSSALFTANSPSITTCAIPNNV